MHAHDWTDPPSSLPEDVACGFIGAAAWLPGAGAGLLCFGGFFTPIQLVYLCCAFGAIAAVLMAFAHLPHFSD